MIENKSSSSLLSKSSSPGIAPIELTLLLTLLALGFIFRVWKLSDIGLDHFDEGVYAFSALGLTDPDQPARLYPEQIKFSPPMYFSLVALSYFLFSGPSDTAAVFVNVLLGTLTVAIVWWIGRTWFDRPAGIAAAALVAFSEYHISISRSALTDVTFAFFFIIALAAVVHALGRRSIAAAILTGLAVGLAWLTKYHGWFVLVIAAMALLLFAWRRRLNRISIMRLLFLWAIIALVAAMCYLPWALYIQSQPGGYTALAKYQRTMLDPHWFRNLWQQIRMQFFFEGALSRSSVLLAFLCVLLVSPGSSLPKHRFLLVLGLLLVSALLIGASGTAVLLTLLAVPALLRKPVSFQGCVILAWLALWFLSAPLYHPYARLILPFMIAAYLTGGYWMSAALEKSEQNLRSPAWHYLAVPAALLVVIAVSVFLPHASNPWRNSRSVANTARAMEKFVPPGSRVIVIGEPALAYYLHLAGRPAFETTNDTVARLVALEKLGAPVYLVAGVYSNRAPPLKKGLEKLQNRLTLIKTFPMEPKDLRVLDDFAPRDARLFRQNPDRTYDLCLYRYSP